MLLLKDIVKEYPVQDNEPVLALKGVSLAFKDTGFVAILGPSGCGKTTLLNIIGGLDHYTSGDVVINGQSTRDYDDRDWDAYRNREIGIVFQSYNLIPHLSVLQNIELAMTLSGVSGRERQQRAKEALAEVGLAEQGHKKPNQLSGGQMQRVALARALVNRPNIVLADEPTGALDSETSVQVMEILKKISKDKLVVMVTHNEALADSYADRIIRLGDGKVLSDSGENLEEERKQVEEESERLSKELPPKKRGLSKFLRNPFKRDKEHTAMDMRTALGISGRNLLTKKAKTVITAIAASIGIIGVGLVLALSNGFTNYVDRMERETLSKFPMSVEKYGYNYVNDTGEELESYPEGDEIHVVEPATSMLHTNKIDRNYIEYLENINTEEKTYAQFHYSYSIGMHVIAKSESTAYGTIYSPLSTSSSSFVESMASTLMGSSAPWQELPASKDQILEQYDILAGTYPDEENLTLNDEGIPDQDEFGLVLVLDSRNSLTTTMLSQLGIAMEKGTYTFEDLLGTTFKYVPTDAYYGDPVLETEIDPDTGKQEPVYRNGLFFKDDVTMDQIMDVFTSLATGDGTGDLSSFASLLDLPTQEEWEEAFKQNEAAIGALTLKYGSAILPFLDKIQEGTFTETDLKELLSGIQDKEAFASDLYDLFVTMRDSEPLAKHFHRQLSYYNAPSESAQALKNLYNGKSVDGTKDIKTRDLKISCILRPKSTTSIGLLGEGLYYPSTLTYQAFADNSASRIAEDFKDHILIAPDETGFQDLFADLLTSYADGETDASDVLESMLSHFSLQTLTIIDGIAPYSTTGDISGYMNARLELGSDIDFAENANFQDPLTYADFVSSITIYPTDFDSKQFIIDYLNAYNVGKPEADQVVYTDIGQMATDMVGQIVQVISAVLIAFASISLVVSSVMIAIIIYSSVVERTKEIGILRSIGARKKDVSRLFKAEAVLIGFLSGLIGILVTYVLSFGISAILNGVFPDVNLGQIAFLNPLHALILLLVSVFLTYVASLVPSRIAAKKDPVTCLRTE